MLKLRGDGGGGHKIIIRWMTSSDSFDVGWTHIQWMIDVRADGAAQSVFSESKPPCKAALEVLPAGRPVSAASLGSRARFGLGWLLPLLWASLIPNIRRPHVF